MMPKTSPAVAIPEDEVLQRPAWRSFLALKYSTIEIGPSALQNASETIPITMLQSAALLVGAESLPWMDVSIGVPHSGHSPPIVTPVKLYPQLTQLTREAWIGGGCVMRRTIAALHVIGMTNTTLSEPGRR